MKIQYSVKRLFKGGYEETAEPRSINPKDDPYYIFNFSHNSLWIGDIVLIKTKYGFWETHSQLFYSYRGQGLGTWMYAKVIQFALKKGLEVRSSLDTSEMAARVWRSKNLRRHFKIVKRGKRYAVITSNSIQLPDWEPVARV